METLVPFAFDDVYVEAAALYRSVGFEKTEEHPAMLWGAERLEQRYEMEL